ncbi:diguanylate cyclase domain-containing protein [Rhodalgimonas zhirmunskyi]|uniref:Diguanylate cyclase n=1 Tax=Rhodalgimonas zhirmunskyi TaxID=2964767 RepID=A0AAJ1X6T4_9RHOB|nr:diguanylate cyclase [Rhodoalgimonas zhirmunskyi]MDQ2095019.1 diguanylate cyclase [Rhodoalgimonas zhirmunskyi]
MNIVGPGQVPQTAMALEQVVEVLDILCPMHVIIAPTGHIVSVGPTLAKLRAEQGLRGAPFLEVFELRRPRNLVSIADLMAAQGLKLHLKFRDRPATAFKGLLTPLPGGAGAVVNLSFGISIVDAVRDYALTSADFAATDLAIEMLYLVEAKSAAMEASRKLNLQLQGAMIAAEEQAFTDTLTGLKNRRAMGHVLDRLITLGRSFALMLIDLDFFKAVNDSMGHAAGDHVLQQVARIMVEETREADTVARIGGDEFVILFDGAEDRAVLDRVARRIIGELEVPIPYGGQLCHISASSGTVLSGDYAEPKAERLLADADLALYTSKKRGRACHSFFREEMRDETPVGPAQNVGEPGESDAADGEVSSGAEIRPLHGAGRHPLM